MVRICEESGDELGQHAVYEGAEMTELEGEGAGSGGEREREYMEELEEEERGGERELDY